MLHETMGSFVDIQDRKFREKTVELSDECLIKTLVGALDMERLRSFLAMLITLGIVYMHGVCDELIVQLTVGSSPPRGAYTSEETVRP